jgi:hypothetical protein
VASTTTFAGQAIVGAIVSTMLTVTESESEPAGSLTVNVTPVCPNAKLPSGLANVASSNATPAASHRNINPPSSEMDARPSSRAGVVGPLHSSVWSAPARANGPPTHFTHDAVSPNPTEPRSLML